MSKQTLDEKGQPIILQDEECAHGVHCDDRGNNACEECLENGRTSSYLLGIAVGHEQAAAMFLTRSGTEYSAGNDEKAKFFREQAKEFTKIAVEKRSDQKKHDSNHPHTGS